MLANLRFRAQAKRWVLFFLFFFGMLRVGWERNLSGSEASYTDGSSYVSKLFHHFYHLIYESCKEICNLKWYFFPPAEFEGPDGFQLCRAWVEPSYFSRCGGGSVFLGKSSFPCFDLSKKTNGSVLIEFPFLSSCNYLGWPKLWSHLQIVGFMSLKGKGTRKF